MAKIIETVAVATTRAPTAQQAMLIKLATRADGVTRAEVRAALGYEDGMNIPVQSILKNIANRFGYVFAGELFEVEGSNRKIAFYTMRLPTKAKTKAAAALTKRGATKTAIVVSKAKGRKAA